MGKLTEVVERLANLEKELSQIKESIERSQVLNVCSKCKNKIPSNANACPYCGSKIQR